MPGTYPISNRAQDLHVDFHYLRRQVGKYLEYGYNHVTWDDVKAEAVQEIIDEGVRMYNYPPLLPQYFGIDVVEWSFLRPIHHLTVEADQRRYPLPETFERPIGDIVYNDTDNDFYSPIKWTSAARLLKLQYQSNFTSYPQYAAYEPAESQGDGPQLQELVLHPTPDSAYELAFQYQATSRRLTADHPYPLGGQVHGSGYLASCLAVAELRKHGTEGPMYKKFLDVLASNIARDHERGAKIVGYNGNGHGAIRGRGALRAEGGLYYNNLLYSNTAYSGS